MVSQENGGLLGGLIGAAEKRQIPDAAIGWGIRSLLRRGIARRAARTPADRQRLRDELLRELRRTPIAIETDKANEQHYEVPTRFFELCLGHRLKYSSCYFATGRETLDEAEDAMLGLTCRRADLRDGQEILELGCGWGSLTLWMAEKYPKARITAVSNSATQRKHIEARAAERGLENITVLTRDVNALEFDPHRFDRCVSVEMFEHVRNYEPLFARIARWLRPDGALFIHIFCHGSTPYLFETAGAANWMGRHFFTGGIMPSDDLFYHFQRDVYIDRHWRVSGRHYEQTARWWLKNLDDRRGEALEVLEETYGGEDADRWFGRWRIFFMACAELWGYRGGREWWVAHYRMRPRPSAPANGAS